MYSKPRERTRVLGKGRTNSNNSNNDNKHVNDNDTILNAERNRNKRFRRKREIEAKRCFRLVATPVSRHVACVRVCVCGLLIVAIWQAGRTGPAGLGWPGRFDGAEAKWKASCHAKAVKVCASALACRPVTGPPFFLPLLARFATHRTTHRSSLGLTSSPSIFFSSSCDLPSPLLPPGYRRRGWIFVFPYAC